MRRAKVIPLLLAAGAAALSAAPSPAAAQRSLHLETFDAEVVVQRDASLLVTETLRPRFTGSWNGIVRVVDLQHTTAAGRRSELEIELVSASVDGDGGIRHEANRLAGGRLEFRVWVPEARDRTATVVLSYRVRGAIRHFAADTAAGPDTPGVPYDELYWQVTGTDWEVPIQRAGARITLPAGATPLQEAAYRGVSSSAGTVPVERRADGIQVPAVGPFPPGEGLTAAVAWPADFVAGPPANQRSVPVPLGAPPKRSAAHPLAHTPLLLVGLVFYLCLRAWRQRGRDPRERAIAVRWEPPPDLTPAEAGTLVDHKPGLHDIISTLVDLAVRGYIRIEEREKTGFLARGSDYRFHLLRPRAAWEGLPGHEQAFLRGLFSHANRKAPAAPGELPLIGGILKAFTGEAEPPPADALDTVRLDDLENEFYKELPRIRSAILNALVQKGHYLQRPDRVRTRWSLLAGSVALVGVFATFDGVSGGPTANAAARAFSFGIAMLISALIIAVFGVVMPARTRKGARTREAALGFRRFLERVESPRYRRMITSPDQFEAYLPYAMAFGCEDRWAKAFEDLLTEPPDWYMGSQHGFRATRFARDMGSLASAATSSLSSSPSSSGSGGGGSVGGGSGGGGGGGF